MLIAEQIERAAAETSTPSSTTPPAEEGLKRDETTEKVVLSFSAKPAASTTASNALSNGGGLKMNLLKPAANPLKANPLKRPNVFKTGGSVSSSATQDINEKKRPLPMSAAERLIVEEQERKRRKMDREGLA